MNILLVAVLVVGFFKVRSGFKRGMVKELIMMASLVIICIMVALISNALKSYDQGQVFNAILMILLLIVLGGVQFLLKPVFFSAKLVVQLPIVSWMDKALGMLVGLIETILMLWTLYFFVMIMDMGAINELISNWTAENVVLKWFFENNYLALFLQVVNQKMIFFQEKL